jgi:hypothetical protein
MYKMVCGLPMGSSFPPTLAILFIAFIEKQRIPNNLDVRSHHDLMMKGRVHVNAIDNILYPLYAYGRFLDDCVGLWCGEKDELIQLLHTFFMVSKYNKTNALKFDKKSINIVRMDELINDKNIVHLDLNITAKEYDALHVILNISTYFKPLSAFQYITPYSGHPSHTYEGIIKSGLKRMMINCSNEDLYNIDKNKFVELLTSRLYPTNIINKIITTLPYSIRAVELDLLKHKIMSKKDKQINIFMSTDKAEYNVCNKIIPLILRHQPNCIIRSSLNGILSNITTAIKDEYKLEIPKLSICFSNNKNMSKLIHKHLHNNSNSGNDKGSNNNNIIN